MKDAMIFFVQVDLGRLGLVWLERDDTTRQELINDIREGQIVDVTAVLECNPVENICNDVTEDILQEAQREHEPIEAADRQALAFDHARDLRKHGGGCDGNR